MPLPIHVYLFLICSIYHFIVYLLGQISTNLSIIERTFYGIIKSSVIKNLRLDVNFIHKLTVVYPKIQLAYHDSLRKSPYSFSHHSKKVVPHAVNRGQNTLIAHFSNHDGFDIVIKAKFGRNANRKTLVCMAFSHKCILH